MCIHTFHILNFRYNPRDSSLTSETYHYERGANQLFSQPSHIFNPNLFPEEDLSYHSDKDFFPVAIHCVVEDTADGKKLNINIYQYVISNIKFMYFLI